MQKYKSITLRNFRTIPQVETYLTEEEKFNIEIVGSILPFKANNYVVNDLIDWENYQTDPIYNLTFPQREMLLPGHFQEMADAVLAKATKPEIKFVAHKIRLELNPHPGGQMEQNLPVFGETKIKGIQHKYRETMLFFPSQGQTCHAYCTFCFRWPQFVGRNELKFAMRDTSLMIKYLRVNPEITDILFTGGDPLIMSTKVLSSYLQPLLAAKIPNLRTIRLGSKALSYRPQRFVTDPDADELLKLFTKAKDAGIHIAFMAHINHPNELKTRMIEKAIERILDTGAVVRTQSPLMQNINDSAEIWATMWQRQVELGCVPYYMFLARDTGAQHYFAVTLKRAWNIFREAYQKVSGIARTVRGPSMSAGPGKVHILGVSEVLEEKVFVLQFIQGRNPDWVARPFFAKYDPTAIWLDDLHPALGKSRFFFEEEYPLDRKTKIADQIPARIPYG